jgi:hypothetical protein
LTFLAKLTQYWRRQQDRCAVSDSGSPAGISQGLDRDVAETFITTADRRSHVDYITGTRGGVTNRACSTGVAAKLGNSQEAQSMVGVRHARPNHISAGNGAS